MYKHIHSIHTIHIYIYIIYIYVCICVSFLKYTHNLLYVYFCAPTNETCRICRKMRGTELWKHLASSAWFNSLPTVWFVLNVGYSWDSYPFWIVYHNGFFEMKSTSSNRNIPTVSYKIRLSHSSSYVAVDSCYHVLFAFSRPSYIIISYIIDMHRESLKDAGGGKWRCSQEKNEFTKNYKCPAFSITKALCGVILHLNAFWSLYLL